ncbi:hypothetical protein [Halobacteriovorax sp.]|uniref:hypothetical protein n=1 Tax=Halobacteriovorax sp. TaxID=2020862 RepID=UPI003AF2131A
MHKVFLILSILCSSVFASSVTSAEYTVSKIINKDGKTLVSFIESATFYKANEKELKCIQESTKNNRKVKIDYDYKTYEIKSCKIVE